jgi:hypothetical protein
MYILSTLNIFGEKYILMHISAVFQILYFFKFLCIFVELDSNCIKDAKKRNFLHIMKMALFYTKDRSESRTFLHHFIPYPWR